jgi:hypothetical protein
MAKVLIQREFGMHIAFVDFPLIHRTHPIYGYDKNRDRDAAAAYKINYLKMAKILT